MQIIDLVYKNSIVNIIQFPDGQKDVQINLPYEIKNKYKFEIQSRFNNFEDLGLIICATKALRRLGVKNISLYIPYLLGSRSDRQFLSGGNSYLVDVVAPIINAQSFNKVTVLDAHSDVSSACINNLNIIDNSDLVLYALKDLKKDFNLIVVDAGAAKKIDSLAKIIYNEQDYDFDIIQCHKKRNIVSGNIELVEVYTNDLNNRPCVIVDDIADGSASFIYCVKELEKVKGYTESILIVTHGIFSKGIDVLRDNFKSLYSTNSYRDIPDDTNFLKQLNIYKK